MPVCIRLVSDTKPRDHISPVLAQLQWLPVNQRITYKLCLLIHLVHVKHCPDYLNNLVHLTADTQSPASRTGNRLWRQNSAKEPSVMRDLLHGTVYLIIFNPSLTLPVLNDLSKLFCFLHALITELCNVSRTHISISYPVRNTSPLATPL